MRKNLFKISFIFTFLFLISAGFFALVPNIKIFAYIKNYQTNEPVCTGSYYNEENTANISSFARTCEDWSNSYDGTVLPESYCLRDEYMIFAGNQNPDGLCWAFSSSMALTTTIMKQTGEYLDFSEQYISTARTYSSENNLLPSGLAAFKNYKPGAGGWFLAFDYFAREYGLVLEQDYNYEIGTQNCVENTDEFYNYYSKYADKNIMDNYITGKFAQYNSTDISIQTKTRNSMKQHLINHGSISMGMSWKTYSEIKINNVLRAYKIPNTSDGGGHALSIIGYDDNFTVTDNDVTYTGAWIALNSWGNSYGNDGIYYILYDDANIWTSSLNVISAYKYKENKTEDLYLYNTISGSNGEYTTNLKGAYCDDFMASNATTKQKNIYYNIDDINMTYTYKISPNTTIEKIEVFKNDYDVTSKFTINHNDTVDAINFRADNLELGAYKILFTYSNSTRTEQTFSSFYLLDGTEIDSVYFGNQNSLGGNIENNSIYQNYNALNYVNEEIIVATTKTSGSIYFKLNLASYNNITSVATVLSSSVLSVDIVLSRNYIYGYIYLSESVTEYIMQLTNANGKTRDVVIKVLYTSDGNDELTSVIYHTNGGKNNDNNSKKVLIKANEGYKIEAPTKEGFEFQGWFYNENLSETSKLKYNDGNYYIEYNKIKIVENPTKYSKYYSKIATLFLYAKWGTSKYTITASCGSPNGMITPKGELGLNAGDSQTYIFTPNEGYKVNQIQVDGKALNSTQLQEAILNGYTFTDISQNHTIKVYFKANTYTLTYNLNYPSSQESLQTYQYKTSINLLTNIVREGYIFIGWYNEISCDTEFTLTTMPANNITVYAKWERLSYEIVAISDDNSEITPNGSTTFYYGDIQTYTFSVNTGYHISEIIVDNVALSPNNLQNAITNGYQFAHINGNHTIEVKSAINTYTIVASSNSYGTITPNGTVTKEYLENQTYTFIANEGYYVASILVDNIKLSNSELNNAINNGYIFTNINKNHTIKVNFAPNQYVITYNLNYAGSQNITESLNCDDNIILITNVERIGYEFAGWYSDENCQNQFTLTKMPANNVTLYAKWLLSYYDITYSLNYDNQILTTQTYPYNNRILLPFNPTREGYDFIGWFSDKNCSSQFTLKNMPNQNITVYASWQIKTYNVNISCGQGGTVTPSGSFTKTYGEYIILNINAYNGYHLSRVLFNNNEQNLTNFANGYQLLVNSDYNISIEFEKNVYNIHYNVGNGGSIDKNTLINKITHGNSHTLKVNTNFNKEIDFVTINDEKVEVKNNTIQLENVTEDLNIVITFKTQSFLLTPVGFVVMGVSAIFMSPVITVVSSLIDTIFSWF